MVCYAILMQWLSMTPILWHIPTSAFFHIVHNLWQHNESSKLYSSAIKIIFLIKLFKWKQKCSVNRPVIHLFLRSRKSRIWAFTPWTQRATAVIVHCNNGKDKQWLWSSADNVQSNRWAIYILVFCRVHSVLISGAKEVPEDCI